MENLKDVVKKLCEFEQIGKTVAVDYSTGKSIYVNGPRYLFRGENAIYPDIRPSQYRFENDSRLSENTNGKYFE